MTSPNGTATAEAPPRPQSPSLTRERYAAYLSGLTDDALLAECSDRALAEMGRPSLRPGWGWSLCWQECRRRKRMALLARAVEEAAARRRAEARPSAKPPRGSGFTIDLGDVGGAA
jgi:hypothetical protein